MDSHPTLHECITSLGLHIRCLQRSGLRFEAARGQHVAQPPAAEKRLAVLRSEIAECRRCHLCSSRTHVVFGEGAPEARLMFVGDAPDDASDAQGRAFDGASGQLLTRIIEAISLQRPQVYVTTAVKCRCPQGEPGDEAIEACRSILLQQIEIIKPEIICALGPCAARALQDSVHRIEPERGKPYRLGRILVMPTHHPELLLRKPELKKQTWDDVRVIQRELGSRSPGTK